MTHKTANQKDIYNRITNQIIADLDFENPKSFSQVFLGIAQAIGNGLNADGDRSGHGSMVAPQKAYHGDAEPFPHKIVKGHVHGRQGRRGRCHHFLLPACKGLPAVKILT